MERTIQQYDAKYALTVTSRANPSIISSLGITQNTPIWYKSAAFTKQMVMLYQGSYSSNSWGWLHMSYRHNWNTEAAQMAVKIAVHQAQYYTVQDNGRYEYDKWFTTTVPFMSWSASKI